VDFQIVWTDPALEDLREIVVYVAGKNSAAAERIGNEIVDHVEALRTFPFIGPVYPRGSSGDYREIVSGKYRIFYRVLRARQLVEILTVWHGSRGALPEFAP
jgi:toxin ParE1/3/4